MFQNILIGIILFTLLIGCQTNLADQNLVISKTEYLKDELRQRVIPIEIYLPLDGNRLNDKLVILSAGYWCANTSYSYISKYLARKGYLVVCIQHELQTDKMLASGSDMYKVRLSNWEEGVSSIKVVLEYIKQNYTTIKHEEVNLIGHSNGGDISMLFATNYPDKVKTCITLDHRRMPIPRINTVRMMSIRADQYAADLGVIPDSFELKKYNIELLTLKNVQHNYLRDNATEATKDFIINRVVHFIE